MQLFQIIVYFAGPIGSVLRTERADSYLTGCRHITRAVVQKQTIAGRNLLSHQHLAEESVVWLHYTQFVTEVGGIEIIIDAMPLFAHDII